MNAFLSILVLLTALTQSSNGIISQPVYQLSTRNTVQTASQPQPAAPVQAVEGAAFADVASLLGEQPSWERARETVLVIPSPDLPADRLEELTADLVVMSRIFDKSLLPARVSLSRNADTGQIFSYVMGRQTSAAQGLYVDGYGVLFFLQIDYPLVPTQEPEEEQSPPQEPGDPVWSQTMAEMSGRQEGRIQTGQARESYDPQRVESLKRTLIKTLVHAANIRTPRPQDLVTVVVGALDDSTAYYSTRSTGTRYAMPGTGAAISSRSSTRSSGRIATSITPAPAGVMIMHVAKSDVDAFAKGQVTLAQFTEKVRTLWSWPNWTASTGDKLPTIPAPASGR
jgi:hypothetical protein